MTEDLRKLGLIESKARDGIKEILEEIKKESPKNTWEKAVIQDLIQLGLVVRKARHKEKGEEIKKRGGPKNTQKMAVIGDLRKL